MSGKDFPAGPVVETLPASAGDMGSIPGPGRFHMPLDNLVHAPQLWAHMSPATEVHTP